MFNSSILSKKPKLLDDNNQPTNVVLSSKTLSSLVGIRMQEIGYVIDGEQARPDLVSMRMYGSDDHQDELCKINGISNPYSMDVGDVVLVPNNVSFSLNLISERDIEKTVKTQPDIRLSFKDVSDKNNPTAIQKFNESFEKGVEEIRKDGSGLPPTLSDFGDKQFLVKGGRVIFAPNIGTCVTNENNPISKGELISKLIKNRLLS